MRQMNKRPFVSMHIYMLIFPFMLDQPSKREDKLANERNKWRKGEGK